MAPDGRARVEAMPKGDPDDNEVLRNFAARRAARRAERDRHAGVDPGIRATPSSARSSRPAFWALLSIAILLWIALRRFGDVLLTLVPLLLAGV